MCAQDCRPGCYCKEGYVPLGDTCVRAKSCPSKCGPREGKACPSIKLQTYLKHIWQISLQTGTTLAIFKAIGYGYQDFNIIINKDLSVDVRQSQNVEVGFTQDKEKQYDL